MGETEVFVAIRNQYKPPEWATLRHVPDQTGWGKSRTADAIAMNLWPSRGLALHGFEIKCDRRDWLSELNNPEKAERIARFCDYFWVVISDESVAKIEEIPEAWGLQVVTPAGKLQILKEATKNESAPQSIQRPFLAALLRKADQSDDMVERVVMQEEVSAAYQRGKAEAEKSAERKVIDRLSLLDSYEKERELFLALFGSNWAEFAGINRHKFSEQFLKGLKAYLDLGMDARAARAKIAGTGRDLDAAASILKRAIDTLDTL